MKTVLLLIVGVTILLGCHPRPIEELSLADLALKAAQRAKADSLASDVYRKAENFYLRAKKDFAEGYFDSAKKYATDARLAAEQAEYQALLKQTTIKGRDAEEGRLRPEKKSNHSNPPGGAGQNYNSSPSYSGPSEGPE